MSAQSDEFLFAPTIGDGVTALACHYARVELRIFPVVMNGDRPKEPQHGYMWKARATSKVNHVVEDFEAAIADHGEANVGIAWALGLDGYVALDLDADEPDWWADIEKVGAVNYTRRGRHIIAPFPDGMTPGNGASRFPTGGWGEVRGIGGYIVIAAADRPGFDAAQLDGLAPFPHPEWLTESGDTTLAATDAEVDAFIDAHTAENKPAGLKGVRTFLEKWTPGGTRSNGKKMSTSRHDTAVEVACWIARDAADGHYRADRGFGELTAWWRQVINGERDAKGRELDSIISWAIGQVDADATPTEVPLVDTTTGEVTGPRLGEGFWTALPVLDHIRTAARARRAAPTAVLGSVLARVAAFTPPSTCVPPFVGGTVPLSIIVALVGTTSTGKSINDRVAADLLPDMPPGVAGPFALGSGEGAAEAYLERYTATDDNGRKVQKQRQVNYGVLFTLDEGRVLTELGSRSGSTIVPTLCTMWTGGDPGRMNASADTRRTLPTGGYTFGLVSLWQPTRMAGLFDDTDGGLPGRFLFLGVNDPDAPDIAPDWPGPIEWTPPSWIAAEGVTRPTPLTYPDNARTEVDARRLAKLRDEPVPALDGHRDLGRLKVAGALALIDGQRNDVADIHWHLAGDLLDSSDRIRGAVLAELDIERRRAEESGNAKAGRREVAKVTAIETKAMDAAVRAVGRKAHKEAPNVVQRQHLTQAIKGTDRKVTGTEAPIEEAERLGYIVPTEGGWIAGESRPAA